MGNYSPPVDKLLTLGRPQDQKRPTDYAALGITAEHVPDLIRLLRDKELTANTNPDVEVPRWYAHIHAWRALGQLRAHEAAEPLLDVLADQEGDNWEDWATEEIPVVLGRFGPTVVPALVARLDRRGKQEWPPVYYARALTEVALAHPEARGDVVAELSRVLETAADNHPGVNGSVVAYLTDLKATEAWPVIERAYATGNVDEGINGDVEHAKHHMGLAPKPPRTYPPPIAPHPSGQNAKQRFNERQRQKKLAKKQRKKKRDG